MATSPRGNNNQVLLDIPNPSNHLVHYVQADLVCIMLIVEHHLKCEEDGGTPEEWVEQGVDRL